MQYCKTLLGKSDVTYCSKNKCLFYQGGSTTVLHSLAMTSYGRPSVSSTYVLVHCAIWIPNFSCHGLQFGYRAHEELFIQN